MRVKANSLILYLGSLRLGRELTKICDWVRPLRLRPLLGLKLGKVDMRAYQASQRGGHVQVKLAGERVLLCGEAVMISRVELLH